MAGNWSDFQAANMSFLNIFLYTVKNAGPRRRTPEMKIQKNVISLTLNWKWWFVLTWKHWNDITYDISAILWNLPKISVLLGVGYGLKWDKIHRSMILILILQKIFLNIFGKQIFRKIFDKLKYFFIGLQVCRMFFTKTIPKVFRGAEQPGIFCHYAPNFFPHFIKLWNIWGTFTEVIMQKSWKMKRCFIMFVKKVKSHMWHFLSIICTCYLSKESKVKCRH